MVGKQQITIAAPDILKGASASDYSQDAGFSPSSYGLNLNYKPGIIYAFPAVTNPATAPNSNLIASCPDSGSGNTITTAAYFIDDAAHFYTLTPSGTFTKVATGSNTYAYLISDLVSYDNSYFASSETDVTLWDGSSGITENWLSSGQGIGTMSQYHPHPMLVYNGFLYIANGNVLYQFNGTSTKTFTLLDTNHVIYALGIDPASGQMLISSQLGVAGDLSSSTTKMLWLWDGASLTPSRKIPMNELIMSFLNVAGVTYVGMGQYIGYWDGNGVQSIRKLQNVTYAISSFPYKPHMASVGNTLYFVDGGQVFACGPLGEAQSLWMRVQRVFYPIFNIAASTASGGVGLIADVGAGQLGIYYKNTVSSSFLLNILSVVTAGSALNLLITNRYEFPRPVAIHRMRVFTTGLTTTTGTGQVGIYNDENGNTVLPAVNQFVVAGTTQSVFDFDFGGYKCNMAQFFLDIAGQTFGVCRIVVYYDVVE